MINQPTLTTGGSSLDASQSESQDEGNTYRQYVQTTVRVERPMNNHGGMRLSAVSGSQTFQVVDYATDAVRLALARAVDGAITTVRLVALGSRGDAWRAVAVAPSEKSKP